MSDRRPDADELGRRIAAAKVAHAEPVSKRAESRGWAIGVEFVGTVLVCGFLGWAIDHYVFPAIKPFGMIALLVLGFAAAVRRAMVTSAQFDNTPANDARL